MHVSPEEDPCVFQVGHSGGLHHDSPSASGEGEAVHREHRGPGSGGQGAGPGESFLVTQEVRAAQVVVHQYLFL